MNDTLEVKLPSGKVAVIRNYTTRADDAKAEQVLYSGVEATQSQDDADSSPTVKISMANVTASKNSYILGLTQSIDGDSTDLEHRINELRSTDYAVLEEAVNKVVEENSPKAQEAKNASKPATNAK